MTADLQDQKARTRIVTDHTSNLFVDAGAGSGKTKQLVDRILSMIARGSLPTISQLAAITFTENAATELRTRIREALEAAAADAARVEAERANCQRALQDFDDAAITTLHGFAMRLLMDAPLEAGLPPGFGIEDAVRTSIGRDTWWRSLLDDWYADPSLGEVWRVGLTLGLNPNVIKDVLTNFDSNWDLLDKQTIPVKPLPALDPQRILTPLQQLIDYAQGGPDGDGLTRRVQQTITPLLREAAAESDPLQVLAIFRDTNFNDAGSASNWKRAGLDKATACGFLGAAREARDDQLTACQVALTSALIERLRGAVLRHAEQRRDRGELWFHDLLVYAVRLLREDSSVRSAVRDRWRVICVDEFQDTDPLQVDLVHLIAGLDAGDWQQTVADGGRLFFVGDPKQSIYRFRRAEVGLFAQVRDAYDTGRLGLVHNFRSRPGILHVVNAVFAQLLAADPLIGFSALEPARDAVDNDPGPDVLFLGGPSTDRIGDIRRVEAKHVVTTLVRACGSWLVGDGKDRRVASYGDMAILVPTRTSLGQLEDALDEYGVPYRIMSRSLLWESDAVRDLITVLQAIDDPADEVALVAALRHAMFGCTDDDLVEWKTSGGRWRYHSPAPESLADSPVAAAMGALKRYHDLRWWLPVNVLLDRVLRERRAVELTAAHRRPRDHWRRLRFVVDQARLFLDSGGSGLTGFVRWAQEQIESAADAIETVTPERDDDAVQILTVHGSKGLEFPVVALTGINSPPVTRGHVIWAKDAPPEVTLFKGFTTSGFKTAQQAEKLLDKQEELRLLYVGMTRAADHLVTSLHHQQGRETHAGRLYEMLSVLEAADAVPELALQPVARADSIDEVVVPAVSLDDRAQFVSDRTALLASLALSLPTSATGLAAEAAQEEPADPLDGESMDAPEFPRPVARTGATLGSAFHRAMELLDFTRADEGAVSRAVAAACAELAVPQLAGALQRRVEAALQAPIVQLAASRTHWKEVPIVVELAGRIVEGFIDLVVETNDGLIVVDYKTDAVRTESDIEARVVRYAPQIQAYAEALSVVTAMPIAPPRLLFCSESGASEVSVVPARAR